MPCRADLPCTALLVAAALVAVLGAGAARSDEGRSQDYAVGARAMGLGGAFTALADDATGVFYNPAGLADVPRPRLSIGTSLYGLELEGATPVESALLRLERGVTAADLIIVPSTTGVAFGVGERLPSGLYRHGFAFSTMVPSYTSRFTETSPTDDHDTRFRSALIDRTLHAGLGYAYRASPWLRAGVAVHYVLRTVDAEESLVSGVRDDDDPSFLVSSTTLRAATSTLRAAVGVKMRVGPRLALGLCATSPGLGAWQSTLFESTSVGVDPDTGDAVPRAVRVLDDGLVWQSILPGTLRAGVAWLEPGDVTATFDVAASLPVHYEVVPVERLAAQGIVVDRVPIPLDVRKNGVVNVAGGVEKMLSNELSVAVGLFTNLSAAPALQLDEAGSLRPGTSRLSNVNMFGGSFAVGLWGAHNVARLGVTGSTGAGQVVVPSSPDARFSGAGSPPLRAVDAVQTFVYVFWSSTFRFGDDATRDFTL